MKNIDTISNGARNSLNANGAVVIHEILWTNVPMVRRRPFPRGKTSSRSSVTCDLPVKPQGPKCIHNSGGFSAVHKHASCKS